jgi:hypothetical protein
VLDENTMRQLVTEQWRLEQQRLAAAGCRANLTRSTLSTDAQYAQQPNTEVQLPYERPTQSNALIADERGRTLDACLQREADMLRAQRAMQSP